MARMCAWPLEWVCCNPLVLTFFFPLFLYSLMSTLYLQFKLPWHHSHRFTWKLGFGTIAFQNAGNSHFYEDNIGIVLKLPTYQTKVTVLLGVFGLKQWYPMQHIWNIWIITWDWLNLCMDMCSGGRSPPSYCFKQASWYFLGPNILQLGAFLNLWHKRRIVWLGHCISPSIHYILTMFKYVNPTSSIRCTTNKSLWTHFMHHVFKHRYWNGIHMEYGIHIWYWHTGRH